jgi:hypothetical protein
MWNGRTARNVQPDRPHAGGLGDLAAGLGLGGCRGCTSRHAITKLLTTRGEVEAAVALTNLLGVGKPVAKVGASRGRWCGPHNTGGQGCRCRADRGHQYSRLHVGILISGYIPEKLLIGIDLAQRHFWSAGLRHLLLPPHGQVDQGDMASSSRESGRLCQAGLSGEWGTPTRFLDRDNRRRLPGST